MSSRIRKLTDQDDLYELFTGQKAPEEKSFTEMLEESLTPDALGAGIQEKDADSTSAGATGVAEIIREYPPVQAELDLHGHTAAEAARKVADFVKNSRMKGFKTLRVISGKGLHSQGKAVLPDVVERTVVECKSKGLVFTFKWESRRKYKSGSLVVYLV